MIVFSGLVAGLFFVLLAGWSWPLPGERSNLTHAIIDASAKSLWISWPIAVGFYFLSIEGNVLLWAIVVLLFAAALVLNAGRGLEATRYDVVVICLYGVLILASAIALVFYEVGYERVFRQWDAIFSWNRWAIELSQNEFKPYNAGYPVLIPGVWSLVYRAQETSEIWLFAKLTLFIVPAMLLLGCHLLWSTGRKLLSIGVFIFAIYFFFIRQNKDLLIGYMDGPATALIFLVSILALCITDAAKEGHKTSILALLTTMAVLAGVAAATKQPGCAAVAILCGLLALLWLRGQVDIGQFFRFVAIALTPPILFLALYYSADGDALSNLDRLSLISEREGQGQDKFWHAVQHMHPIPLFGLFALGCLNIVKIRTITGQLGLLTLALGVAFFAIYMNCCTYDERNSHAVLVLFASSAMFGLASFYKEPNIDLSRWDTRLSLSARRIFLSLALAAGVVVLLAQAFVSDQQALALQKDGQWKIAKPEMRKFIKENLSQINEGDVFVSSHRRLQWLPGFKEKFEYCREHEADCAMEGIKSAERAFIMLKPSSYNNLEQRLANGKRIGRINDFTLYGPIAARDISP